MGKNGNGREGKRRRAGNPAACVCVAAAVLALGGCAGGRSGVKLSSRTVELTADYRSGGQGAGTAAAGGEAFKESYLDFSLELLRRCRTDAAGAPEREEGRNIMVSPASVMLALEMTRCGAREETLSQMNETLYPGITPEQGREGSMALFALLDGEASGRPEGMLTAADSVWIRTGDIFVPDEEFLRTVAADYGAQIYGAPFDDDTCDDINRWVEQKTGGQIRDILEGIPEDAMMYLVNAVSFEAEWEEPYDSYQVHDAAFYGADGSQTQVPMMYSGEWRYLFGEHVQGFVKPYKDGCSFAALLPEEGMTLDEYLAGLDGEELLEVLSDVQESYVEAGLPKFESMTGLELADILAGMGMPAAFDPESADFGGMGCCGDGYALCIGRVIHQTHICVDEQGTEAAAATIVEMDAGGAAPSGNRVILNRPFLYAIIEDGSGLPVFLGTVERF